MSVAAFTPGPWLESEAGDGVLEARDGADRICICVVGNPEEALRERDRANMRLIKAAPEMISALAAALPELEQEAEQREHSGNDEYVEPVKRAAEALRAAIAKAQGAQP